MSAETVGASYATRDPEAAHDHLARMYTDHTMHLRGSVEDFWMENSFQAVGPVLATNVRHATGALYEANPGMHTTMLAFTGTGRVERTTVGETVRADVGNPFLMAEPHRPYEIGFDGPIDLRMLVVESVAFSDLTDRYLPTSDGLPRFTSLSPVSTALSRHCVEVAEFVRTNVAADAAVREQPLLRDSAARMLAAAIVATFPHVTVEPTNDHGDVASTAVRRAIDYIEAHAGEPIGLAEIAQHAGIGARALQLAFRRHLDTTPTQYLRRVRLDRAHHDLVQGSREVGVSVSEVAMRWGFGHLGRFAATYRDAYGRTPRQTLGRSSP